jgi:hypothetical protein
MWRRITQPHTLIYLDVSWRVARRRRPIDGDASWWQELNRRLQHARRHADLYLNTDSLTGEEVLNRVLDFLRRAWEISK